MHERDDLLRETARAKRRSRQQEGRRAEPRIVDPYNHPRSTVCLAVAAEFLKMDERTVLVRIDERKLRAIRDGKVYRIALADLLTYERERREAS